MLVILQLPLDPLFMEQTKRKVHIRPVLTNKNLDIVKIKW